MQINIKLPDIGEGVVEAEILDILVTEGDKVVEDQALLTVMTDKAAVEIPAPCDGIITNIIPAPCEIVAVGSVIITISSSDSLVQDLNYPQAGNDVQVKSDNPQDSESPENQKNLAKSATELNSLPPLIRQENQHEKENKLNSIDDKTQQKIVAQSPNNSNIKTPQDLLSNPQKNKVLASPSVRRRARNIGLNLMEVHNHICQDKKDIRISHMAIDQYLQSFPTVNKNVKKQGVETIKLRGIRRIIAQKMEQSYRLIPHFSYVEEINVTQLMELRQQLNNENKNKNIGKLTFLPFFIKAICNILPNYSQINGHFNELMREFHHHHAVHMGIATATDNGLIVPVIHHAESLDIYQCAKAITEITQKAHSNKLATQYLKGSTITITSLGMLGGITSTPIINAPEVAIIGINKIQDKLVLQNGNLKKIAVMNISASFDHRIIDGHVAASFINDIKKQLEYPAKIFM